MAKIIDVFMNLHESDGNCLLLDSQDVYEYVGEKIEAEIEFAYYIDKWCEYLNSFVLDNKELAFGNINQARLDGWLKGYEFGKGYVSERKNGFVTIKAKRYRVTLKIPYEEKGEHNGS